MAQAEEHSQDRTVVRVSEPVHHPLLVWREIARELARSRGVAWALASREIKVRYKHSLLGIGWALFTPLLSTIIFTAVFTRAVKIDTGGVPYAIFAYIGLVPWIFFSTSLLKATESLRANSNLVTKVYFPRETLPISCIISSLIDCAIAAVLVVAMMFYFGYAPKPGILLVPLVFAIQLVLMTGLALLLAAGNMFFRDVGLIIQVLIPLWMWASNVVYPLPDTGPFRYLNVINPMTPLLRTYRDLIIKGTISSPEALLVAGCVSILLTGVAIRLFHSWESRFGEMT